MKSAGWFQIFIGCLLWPALAGAATFSNPIADKAERKPCLQRFTWHPDSSPRFGWPLGRSVVQETPAGEKPSF